MIGLHYQCSVMHAMHGVGELDADSIFAQHDLAHSTGFFPLGVALEGVDVHPTHRPLERADTIAACELNGDVRGAKLRPLAAVTTPGRRISMYLSRSDSESLRNSALQRS